MNYTSEDVKGVSAGDIFSVQGKKYRLLKKTTTAIAAQRYYWFESWFDLVKDKLCQSR